MEMLDKFIYDFFGKLDKAIAFIETYAIKFTEWCWQTRVRILKKRRKK
jgi:hypothetical protein